MGRSSTPMIVCDMVGAPADAETVDALARLQLVAQRIGHRVCLRRASTELQDLIALAGLRDVLPLYEGRLRAELQGEPEERE